LQFVVVSKQPHSLIGNVAFDWSWGGPGDSKSTRRWPKVCCFEKLVPHLLLALLAYFVPVPEPSKPMPKLWDKNVNNCPLWVQISEIHDSPLESQQLQGSETFGTGLFENYTLSLPVEVADQEEL
jgi:hypothetical protein